MASQQPQPASLWNSPVPYQRIRITSEDDLECLYPLIASYISSPSLADSVTELVLNTEDWPSRWSQFWAQSQQGRPPLPVRDDAHAALEAHVRGLGLGDPATEAMVRALEWKRQHLKGEDAGAPKDIISNTRKFAMAAAVVLLSVCRNIVTLYVGDVREGRDSPLTTYLLKSNYGLLAQPGLQRLERVEIITGNSMSSDERSYGRVEFLEYFQYFHRLPAIQSVVAEGVQEYQANLQVFVPRTGNIKKIHIGYADASVDMLATIIRIPKALEEFKLSLGGLWSTDGGLPVIVPSTLGKSLFQHKDTLKVLDLDIEIALNCMSGRGRSSDEEDNAERDKDLAEMCEKNEYFRLDRETSLNPLWTQDPPDTRSYGHTIGSLHDFKAMTHLSIGMKALMGPVSGWQAPFRLAEQPPARLIDALPRSLEYLCFYGYTKGSNEDIDGQVQELMEKRAERLPLLKEVRGVDEMVLDMGSIYSEDCDEDDLWERPERDLGWVEV